MSAILEFLQKRKRYTNEYFASPGSRRTVLICSHVWWTEAMAYALLKLGYNVLVAEPWYLLWLEDGKFLHFDKIFNQWVQTLRKFGVQLVIGGNSTVMAPHPKTKELLHRAAGVPAVNYWWDDPRALPPIARRGLSVYDYMNAVRDSRTLNVIWDGDVCEELRRFLALDNVVHVPLGTTPELWQTANAPLQDRLTALCFLGNNHEQGDWLDRSDPKSVEWAGRVADVKLANPDKPMADCVETVGGPGEVRGNLARRPYELAPSLKEEFERWSILAGLLARRTRNPFIQAAAELLGNDFVLIGKGWDALRPLGLAPRKESSGIPDAKDYYAGAKASLNLVGGTTHAGLSLRPYEIASSHGLLFTRYNRELPSLFESGKECVAFRTPDEMKLSLERILHSPQEYDAIVAAGRERVVAEHTWEHRLRRVLQVAKERFDLPWKDG